MIDEQAVLECLREVYDPELGIDIVELGLIYSVEVEEKRVRVAMTTTTHACPLNSYLRDAAVAAVRRRVPEETEVQVDIVWDPPWNPAMMSERARQQLGW